MIDGNELYTTGKAAKKAGVSTQTLQYYIMLGLIEPTETSDTNRRYYNQQAIEKIKMVKNLNETGYPLRAIKELFIDGTNSIKDASDG